MLTLLNRSQLNFLSLLVLPAFFLLPALNLQAQAPASAVTPATGVELGTWLKSNFGPNVEVARAKPMELKGDFNGDGFQDLAVVVSPRGKRGELAPGVNIVLTTEGARELEPTSIMNGKNSLAVIHGAAGRASQPKDKFLIYAFGWIGWNGPETGPLLVLPKAKQKRNRRGYVTLSPENLVHLPDVNQGDVIVVPTEAGINTILYWDGKKYRFWLAPGD
jgi:FG-GAP repeat.